MWVSHITDMTKFYVFVSCVYLGISFYDFTFYRSVVWLLSLCKHVRLSCVFLNKLTYSKWRAIKRSCCLPVCLSICSMPLAHEGCVLDLWWLIEHWWKTPCWKSKLLVSVAVSVTRKGKKRHSGCKTLITSAISQKPIELQPWLLLNVNRCHKLPIILL